MANARRIGREKEFFRINPGTDLKGGLQMSRIVADNFLFVFIFLSNGLMNASARPIGKI